MEMMAEVGVRLQLGMRPQLGVLRYRKSGEIKNFSKLATVIT